MPLECNACCGCSCHTRPRCWRIPSCIPSCMPGWLRFRLRRTGSSAGDPGSVSQVSLHGEGQHTSVDASGSSRPVTPPTPRLLDSPRPGHQYPCGTRYPPLRTPPPSPESPRRSPSPSSTARHHSTTHIRESSASTMATRGSAAGSSVAQSTTSARSERWDWWSPRTWYRRYRVRSRGKLGPNGRVPPSPPPPSSHSLVPPSRLARWRLQARARLRLQASRLAALHRWGRRFPTRPQGVRRGRCGMGVGVGVGVGMDTAGGAGTNTTGTPPHILADGDDAGRWRPLAMLTLPGLTRRTVRFLDPTVLFRRGSTATPPHDLDALGDRVERDSVEMRPTSPAMTAHTRATSADYDSFGPTLALRMKRRPRRFSI